MNIRQILDSIAGPYAQRFLATDSHSLKLLLDVSEKPLPHLTTLADVAEGNRPEMSSPGVASLSLNEIRSKNLVFDRVISLGLTHSQWKTLAPLTSHLAADGKWVLRLANQRYHQRICALISGNQGDLSRPNGQISATLGGIERSFYRLGLEFESVFSEFGEGYHSWKAGGRSPKLNFSAYQYCAATVEEAEEHFVASYTLIAGPSNPRNHGLTSVLVDLRDKEHLVDAILETLVASVNRRIEMVCLAKAVDRFAPRHFDSPAMKLVVLETHDDNRTDLREVVEACTGEQICLLAPEIRVTTGWLDGLVDGLLDSPLNGAVGPMCNGADHAQYLLPNYGHPSESDGFAWKLRADRRLLTTSTLGRHCILTRKQDLLAVVSHEDGGLFHELPDRLLRSLEDRGKRILVASHVYVHQADFGGSRVQARTDISATSSEDCVPSQYACKLSLCMIVRDNEAYIRDCLESVKPWVDEMIVVDTGSIDQTPAICQEVGAEVYHFPWCDDFSAARNESLRHANGEWIFWMDSDDILPTDQGKKLRLLPQKEIAENCQGFVMQVHCPSRHHGQLTVVDQVKVFRNVPELRFEHRIHEQILPSIRRHGGEVEFTDIHVVHLGSQQDDQSHQKKLERDFRILELENAERPNHPFVLFNLGMTCENAGEYARAEEYLRRCIRVSAPKESHLRKAWALLICCLQQLQRFPEATEAAEEALESFPDDAELLFRRALLAQLSRRYDQAIADYEAVLSMPAEQIFASVDPSIRGAKAYHNLGSCYRAKGDRAKALELFQRAIDDSPQMFGSWIGMAEIALELGNIQHLQELLAREELEKLEFKATRCVLSAKLFEHRGDIERAAATLESGWQTTGESCCILELADLFARNENWEEENRILQTLLPVRPNDINLLLRLAKSHSGLGDTKSAIQMLERTLEIQPDSSVAAKELEKIQEASTSSTDNSPS